MDVDLDRIHDVVYERAAFTVFGVSEVLQVARVRNRIKSVGCDSFDEYLVRLGGDGGEELQALVNLLTVNETYFFREYDQLAYFAEDALPALTEASEASGERAVRVLCGACASGEEAYTLAIILLEILEGQPPWRIEVVAVDINTGMLERARAGLYSARALRDMPHSYKARYFRQVDGSYQVVPALKEIIRFEHVNLVASEQMRRLRGFDVAFSRNVLIYLDPNQRERLIHELYHCLRPGGALFIGASESIGQFSNVFELVKLGRQFVYQKPKGRAA